MIRIRNLWQAIGFCIVAVPAAAAGPEDDRPALSRLSRVVELIDSEYVVAVDWPALIALGVEGIRLEAGLPPEDMDACMGKSPSDDRGALVSLETAVECAERGERPQGSSDRLVAAAIRAMLSGLDPLSRYYTPDDMDWLLGRGSNAATTGLAFPAQSTEMKIRATLPSSPAREAGIVAGETLVAVDGVPVEGQALDTVQEMLRGADASAVLLTLRDAGGKVREVRLVRRVLDPLATSFESGMRDDVLIIRLHSLGRGVADAVGRIVEKRGDEARALLLDLRGNPGGLLLEAVAIADQFLDKGEIVTSRGRADKEDYHARKGALAPELPLILLVDNDTASGAEIIAAALQDHGRARIAGERSRGAGSVQTLIPVDDRHLVALTTSYQYRPNGKPLGEAPIEPDCPLDAADHARQLAAAVALAVRKGHGCEARPDAPGHSASRD